MRTRRRRTCHAKDGQRSPSPSIRRRDTKEKDDASPSRCESCRDGNGDAKDDFVEKDGKKCGLHFDLGALQGVARAADEKGGSDDEADRKSVFGLNASPSFRKQSTVRLAQLKDDVGGTIGAPSFTRGRSSLHGGSRSHTPWLARVRPTTRALSLIHI